MNGLFFHPLDLFLFLLQLLTSSVLQLSFSVNILNNEWTQEMFSGTHSSVEKPTATLRSHRLGWESTLKRIWLLKLLPRMRGCSGWRLFHLLGMLGPRAEPSSSHQIQQEPWEVRGTQFPSDLPALPQEHSQDLTTVCTNFLLVCFSHYSHGKYPAGKGAHSSSSQSQQETI